MFFVYILQSVTGKYYVGCTNDTERRIKEHNMGLSRYTRKNRPWILKYSEKYLSLSEARRREKQIKNWKKRKAIEALIIGPVV